MQKRPLGLSGLMVAPVILGGNVFGWTADEAASFAVLDAATDAGLNAIDTADVYSRWVPGHTGGESEAVIGRWLKARPGQANYGSYGNASASHLAGELFKAMAGVDMLHVPYKGAAPAQADIMGGVISLMFSDMSAMQHAKTGRLRALAITSSGRVRSFPEVPTVAEAGPPGAGLASYEVAGWFALYAPAGTPANVVARLSQVLGVVLGAGDARNRIAGLGLEPGASTPEVLAALMQTERSKWQKLIADAKIKVE